MQTAKTIVGALAVAASACATLPPRPPALCALEQAPTAVETNYETWIALVLRGYDRATGKVTVPALDCTGAQVRWDGPALACEDGALARTELTERQVGPSDVITATLADGSTLVWIPTRRYASGDAMGPVALIERTEGRLEVMVVGALRASPRGARLRVERMAETRVLVAEGESCLATDRTSCTRSARLVPMRDGRFVPTQVLGTEGHCQSPAWFDLSRRERRRGANGWELLELTATMGFGAGGLGIEERLVVQDLGKEPGASPIRVLHRAQASRAIKLVDGRLLASEGALWSRLVQPLDP
jgi:hypothetical protein